MSLVWESYVYFHVLGLVRQYIMTGIDERKVMVYGIIAYTLLQDIYITSTKHSY